MECYNIEHMRINVAWVYKKNNIDSKNVTE